MKYRVLVFDDDRDIRQILRAFFDRRGYEVFTFRNTTLCHLSEKECCSCPEDQTCTDIIVTDVNMPFRSGLEFIEEQIRKGCRCKHLAVMSGEFTEAHFAQAKSLGLKIFKKPFNLADMTKWLDRIEKEIGPNRKLVDWPQD